MLSPRLRAVADRVQGPRHADIGSDHASLPLELSRHLEKVIAVEKYPGPLARTRSACLGSRVEVREGDGLAAIDPGELDSLSICGMGALNIRDILRDGQGKLPLQLVLQPMDNPQPIRHWARQAGYHLVQEVWTEPYTVLEFLARPGEDPVYQGLPNQAAEFYGPILPTLPGYRQWLNQQQQWLKSQPNLQDRLTWIEQLLSLTDWPVNHLQKLR